MPLSDRLAAAAALLTEAGDRLPAELRASLRTLVERAEGRLAITGDHTVVALAGPTGVGKSSLTNALLGADLADVGVVRPTTAEPLAVAVGTEPPRALVGHLALRVWEQVPATATGGVDRTALDGLLLVDLPDHDSVRTEHRERAAGLVATADRLVWVVDPEKYADASVHDDLLVPLREHAGVLTVVCNRLDRVADDERDRLLAHLHDLLRQRGMGDVEVLGTSVADGTGLGRLRDLLATSVANHRAAAERVEADLRGVATALAPHVPAVDDATPHEVSDRAVDAALRAAGVPAVLDAVAATHRHRAVRATGWPVTRRLRARGRDPLARLGLGRLRDRGEVGARSSRGAPQGVAAAGLGTAVRAEAEQVVGGWPDGWRDPALRRLDDGVADLPVALDRAIARTDLDDDRHPLWWRLVGALQWLALAAVVVGLGWLGAVFVVDWFGLPSLPTAEVAELPWPTVAVGLGIAVGLLLALLSTPFARLGAARARRRVARRVEAAVRTVVDETLGRALTDEVATAADATAQLRRVAGRDR